MKEEDMFTSKTVFVFIRDNHNRVLLVFNKKEPRKGKRFIKPSGWGLPGGQVEPGELEIDAVYRELKEETGISKDCAEIDLKNRNMVYWEEKDDKDDPEGEHAVFVVCAQLKVPSDLIVLKPQLDSDVEEAAWHDLNELPKNLYHSHRIRIKYFQNLV